MPSLNIANVLKNIDDVILQFYYYRCHRCYRCLVVTPVNMNQYYSCLPVQSLWCIKICKQYLLDCQHDYNVDSSSHAYLFLFWANHWLFQISHLNFCATDVRPSLLFSLFFLLFFSFLFSSALFGFWFSQKVSMNLLVNLLLMYHVIMCHVFYKMSLSPNHEYFIILTKHIFMSYTVNV